MNRFVKKFMNPGFFVCDYATGKNQVVQEKGSFAALGETREEAEKDAVEYLRNSNTIGGPIAYNIRKPNLLERFRAAQNA